MCNVHYVSAYVCDTIFFLDWKSCIAAKCYLLKITQIELGPSSVHTHYSKGEFFKHLLNLIKKCGINTKMLFLMRILCGGVRIAHCFSFSIEFGQKNNQYFVWWQCTTSKFRSKYKMQTHRISLTESTNSREVFFCTMHRKLGFISMHFYFCWWA